MGHTPDPTLRLPLPRTTGMGHTPYPAQLLHASWPLGFHSPRPPENQTNSPDTHASTSRLPIRRLPPHTGGAAVADSDHNPPDPATRVYWTLAGGWKLLNGRWDVFGNHARPVCKKGKAASRKGESRLSKTWFCSRVITQKPKKKKLPGIVTDPSQSLTQK